MFGPYVASAGGDWYAGGLRSRSGRSARRRGQRAYPKSKAAPRCWLIQHVIADAAAEPLHRLLRQEGRGTTNDVLVCRAGNTDFQELVRARTVDNRTKRDHLTERPGRRGRVLSLAVLAEMTAEALRGRSSHLVSPAALQPCELASLVGRCKLVQNVRAAVEGRCKREREEVAPAASLKDNTCLQAKGWPAPAEQTGSLPDNSFDCRK